MLNATNAMNAKCQMLNVKCQMPNLGEKVAPWSGLGSISSLSLLCVLGVLCARRCFFFFPATGYRLPATGYFPISTTEIVCGLS
jgi:hypothetical protein